MMTIISTKKNRVNVALLSLGRRWGWGTIKTHWGHIHSISLGPLWILWDVFDDYELAIGQKPNEPQPG